VAHPTEGALVSARLPILFSADAPGPPRPAPRLGEHSAEILRALGYPPDEVRRLIETGALRVPSEAPPVHQVSE
jgi:crotonobetainyl-CoA:carnitine CoA-transferase CaiB-like acyl-CoA transferase